MAYLRIPTCPINYTVQTHKEREREREGETYEPNVRVVDGEENRAKPVHEERR